MLSSSESIGLADVSGVGGAEGAILLLDLVAEIAESTPSTALRFFSWEEMLSLGRACLNSS